MARDWDRCEKVNTTWIAASGLEGNLATIELLLDCAVSLRKAYESSGLDVHKWPRIILESHGRNSTKTPYC